MAFQAVPDAAEVIVNFLANTKEMVSTMAARKPGGYTLADLVVLAVAVDLAISTNWLPVMSQDVNYVSTTVRGLAFENDQETTVDTGAGTGGVLANAMPGNVTVSVKKGSGLTGRSARGRLYFIGMVAADLQANENLLTVVASDAIEAAVEAARVAITATVWTAAIVSRFTAGLPRTPTGTTFEWTETDVVNLSVDSQRRRLIR